MPVKIDFISIGTSPEDLNITEGIQFTRSPQISLTGRHVLLVEDIIGTGLTLGYICQHLESSQPASLKICSLLDNPEGRILTINTDYCCFTMPNISVVGYGLDYNEEYRNLRYIAEYRV
jgi:hypoxanthine phosphoribosyltransferase